MKRTITLLILAVFVFSMFGKTIITADSTFEKGRIMTTVTDYLDAASRSQYLYEQCDLNRNTIASVPESSYIDLAEKASEYAEFRSALEYVPYEDTAISSGRLNALLNNLKLNNDCVAFYAHLGESSDTTYDYFTISYDIVRTEVNGDLAVIDLYEYLDFKYSDVDFTSAAEIRYFVSLIKYDGNWLIMALESSDDLYESYRETGYELF